MGATDRILQGESTFMVEMKEMSSMLSKMNDKSFLLIDEIGRGTSTQDGLSIAQALLEYLHEKTKAIGIFATHYHELSEVASQLNQCANASMSIREWEGELIFLRTLEWKAASSSYGIHVAEMAGIPSSIVERARNLWKKGDSSKQDSLKTEKSFIETQKAPVKEKKLQKDKNSLENLPLFKD
jgi:DNA mismatch repair protein MutS